MHRGPTGWYATTSAVGAEVVRAFVPNDLPPAPPLNVSAELRERLDAALLALGRLDSVTTVLPDTQLFLYTYVRKEAVLSSQIEGTRSSLSELLLFEADDAPGVPGSPVVEVSNYAAALEHGLKRTREGFPLSSRLIREIHGILLSHGRGAEKQPGEFRRSQNWIGGTRPGNAVYVPPPTDQVDPCMSALEKWLHDKSGRTPTLIKAALAHAQFETIHPFLDGNGRVGRLLIALVLCVEQVLSEPLLYLSLYLKRHRDTYYAHLDSVRSNGSWEEWLDFFATGVQETAGEATANAKRLVTLFRADQDRLAVTGRLAGSALRVLHALQKRPVGSAGHVAALTGLSMPAANKALATLQDLQIARELTGRRRNRVFAYDAYLQILSEGTEPL